MATSALILAVGATVGEVYAVHSKSQRLECVFKPTVLLIMLVYLHILLPSDITIHAAVSLSCLGDVFLLFNDRFFLAGLVSFLLAHVGYLVALASQFTRLTTAAVPLGLVLVLLLAFVLRPIVQRLANGGKEKEPLVVPVLVYGCVIALMTFAAQSTMLDSQWLPFDSMLVGGGASLFLVSDVILAWNKFVKPSKHGDVANIICYFVGQIMLIVGLSAHFHSKYNLN